MFQQPNMNDPLVLNLYTQLVKFQQDIFREHITFDDPNRSLQNLLHSLARQLDLEYEYSLSFTRVKISKASPMETMDDLVSEERDETLLPDLNLSLSENPDLLAPGFIEDGINSLFPDIFLDDLGFNSNILDFPNLGLDSSSDSLFPIGPHINPDGFSSNHVIQNSEHGLNLMVRDSEDTLQNSNASLFSLLDSDCTYNLETVVSHILTKTRCKSRKPKVDRGHKSTSNGDTSKFRFCSRSRSAHSIKHNNYTESL